MVRNKNSNIFLLVCALIFFSSAIVLNRIFEKPKFEIDKQNTALNINSSFIQFFSLGNNRLVSNLIWIQTLLESDEVHYKRNYLSNWMYLRFLTIAKLDPQFYENYLYGGMYLSIIKDDLLGAADLFETGFKYYPDDYYLNYYAGFNYFYELGDYEKGLELLQKIENHPKTPTNLKFVISKLRYETTNNFEVALEFLKNNLALAKDDHLRKKISLDIYSLIADRDLACLNGKKGNCSKLDAEGNNYILDKNGNWKAQREFNSYKIFRQK